MSILRPARIEDLEAIVGLCAEHAAFERAPFHAEHAQRALGRFLFGEPPRAWCIVAEVDSILVGYATFSLEFSTWRAAEYVHMDCLFVKSDYRNAGLGRQLIESVGRAALARGGQHVEWQTPSWNAGAIRFYDRLGATGNHKVRYQWKPC
ncbi:MAG TPA: GNAT family N-acetyltransferase [Thermoanaerobaculia bacterium]|nr:GNAT family N-acetyltransferase [Thermoanaerobaculia bacterium]